MTAASFFLSGLFAAAMSLIPVPLLPGKKSGEGSDHFLLKRVSALHSSRKVVALSTSDVTKGVAERSCARNAVRW